MILSSADDIRRFTDAGWWGTQTLWDLWQACVAAQPERVAVVDPANRPDLTGSPVIRVTFAELHARALAMAGGLQALGLKPDDIIVVQLPNVAELIVTYLAAARLGLVVSPVPVQYRTHELGQILALTQARAFITLEAFGGHRHADMALGLQSEHPALAHVISLGEAPGCVSFATLLAAPPVSAEGCPAQANDLFSVCWTSGTEAAPKGVPRSHNLWISIAYATVDGAGLRDSDVLLCPFPIVNMSGIGGMLVPWLLTASTLVLHHPLALPVFLQQIASERVTYTVAPPVLLNLLLANPNLVAGGDISSLRCIGSGSAPLSVGMVTGWKERYGIDVTNFFGANEGTALISAPDDVPDPADRARYFPRFGHGERVWRNRAAAGMRTRLVDPLTGDDILTPDQAGELRIQGPTVFAGYWRRPDLAHSTFDEHGYFRTGDLFALEGDGLDRYRFVGRLKDLIIRGGMKIAPEEVEALLISHPKLADVAVVGMKDRALGEERICACVVPKPDQTVTLSELHDHLKAKDVAAYKFPKALIVLPALPRNPLGKVLKSALREMSPGD